MYTYSRADSVFGTGDRRGSKISFIYCPHGPYKLRETKKMHMYYYRYPRLISFDIGALSKNNKFSLKVLK